MSLRTVTFLLAVSGALALFIAGPGVQLGLWDFRGGFLVLRGGAYLGAAGALGALVMLATRPGRGHVRLLVTAAVVGAGVVLVPLWWQRQARRVPPIHDITTDVRNPPQFNAILPLRARAPNPSAYGGPEVAAMQQREYPDIQPLRRPERPGASFVAALGAARAEGWEIVSADSAAGRIEATAVTPWFGFRDDVVVRITAEGGGSRIDVRSVSRVGKSDVGTNARRIRRYLGRLAT